MRDPVRRSPRGAIAAFGCASILTIGACGPVQSTSLIIDAQAELTAAETAGGEKMAPFEYAAAEEYLHKAREEQSYADFEVASRFAQKSKECARAARQLADKGTRTGMGVTSELPKKTAKCRPGPERAGIRPDPSDEPAAAPPVPEPADPKPGPAAPVKKAEPSRRAPGGEPEDPPPPPPETTPPPGRKIVKPKVAEDPLPDGDVEPPAGEPESEGEE